jgi:hypothetical protein
VDICFGIQHLLVLIICLDHCFMASLIIWLNRNDMVINKATSNTYIHVIFRASYWIGQWSMLHGKEEQDYSRWAAKASRV